MVGATLSAHKYRGRRLRQSVMSLENSFFLILIDCLVLIMNNGGFVIRYKVGEN